MKAVRIRYDNNTGPSKGSADTLTYETSVEKPQPSPNQVLVKVHATTFVRDELEWQPTYYTLTGAPRTCPIPGHDVSGTITAVGSNLIHDPNIKVGDEVYGLIAFHRDGAFGEYAIALPSELAPKPMTVQHADAAALPLSALTAYQALMVHAELKKGQKLLITGAAGGVGVYAVQIAKWVGAHVIGTASSEKAEFLKSLGVDEVIDYTQAAFDEVVHDVDTLLDTVGGDTLVRSWKCVKEGGILVAVSNPTSEEEKKQYPKVKAVWFIVEPNREELVVIGRLVDAGHLKVVVDRVMRLEQAREAYTLVQTARTKGKIVLQIVG